MVPVLAFFALFKHSSVFKGHVLPALWCSGVPGGCVPRTGCDNCSWCGQHSSHRAEMWQKSTPREHQQPGDHRGDGANPSPWLLQAAWPSHRNAVLASWTLTSPSTVGLVLRGSLSLRAALTAWLGRALCHLLSHPIPGLGTPELRVCLEMCMAAGRARRGARGFPGASAASRGLGEL